MGLGFRALNLRTQTGSRGTYMNWEITSIIRVLPKFVCGASFETVAADGSRV